MTDGGSAACARDLASGDGSAVEAGAGQGVAIRARGFGWRFASRRAWALRGVDLEVAAGERVLLLGRSGAGKSTLLAGLAGLLDPGPPGSPSPPGRPSSGLGEQEGTLELTPAALPGEQAPVADQPSASRRVVGRGPVAGLLLQDPLAQTVLARCGDDVAFGLENHGVPAEEIWPRVDAALDAVGFPYPRAHPTARLSGGERQRLALAGVLALRPGLILLDEPTAMLDPEGARLLRSTIARVLDETGASCVLIEHRIEPWLPMIDRVVVLQAGGGVLADGTPEEVLRTRGAELAAGGVWVPGFEPKVRAREGRAIGRPPMITGEDLAVGRGREAHVVHDVDLALGPGQALCVTGPNGSGKSTLALALAGLTAPQAGTIRFEAQATAPHTWRPRELITRIGMVFQEPQHQFVAATVADELAVGPRRLGMPEDEIEARVGDLLQRLRLRSLARANPFTLSGGEQRRLSVATVLATRPRLLVLDEPTFGQDARTWSEITELLLDLLEAGSAVIAATHDTALVAALTGGGRGSVLRLGVSPEGSRP